MQKKILVVDDEPAISTLIEFNLKLVGFEVMSVYDGEAALEMIPKFRPDLIVLDLMLPKMDGFQVCLELRNQNNMVPIIMLSALHDLPDKIAGLDNGADDYMTKPFSSQELISRIQAILRRNRMFPAENEMEILEFGSIRILSMQREVYVNNRTVNLTPKEFELLLYLCKHRGRVLSRQQLLQGVWDYHFHGDTRIVDVHISHLRDKLENNARSPEYIVTIRNVGYKLMESAKQATGM